VRTYQLTAAAATAVVVAALAAASPVAAATGGQGPTPPPASVTAPPTTQTDCATIVSRLPTLAAHGVPNAICSEPATETSAEAVASLAAAAPEKLPRWCARHAFTGWWATRTQACSIQDWFLNVYDTATAEVIGHMGFLVLNLATTSATDSDVQQWLGVRSYSQTGLAAGTKVWGLADCEVEWCALDDLDFPTQPLTDGADVGGTGYFITFADRPGDVGSVNTSVTILLSNPAFFVPGVFSTVAAPRGRCDNATPGVSVSGCVFADYVPAWVVDPAALPRLARDVRDSQRSGLPATLTRLTDAALVDRNAATACPATLPVPDGLACADYPFRSAHQGAATGGGSGRTFPGCRVAGLPTRVTGPDGYSVCLIPAAESSAAGADLDAFYAANRVIEADPYVVRVP
jgi:hypothetical protein